MLLFTGEKKRNYTVCMELHKTSTNQKGLNLASIIKQGIQTCGPMVQSEELFLRKYKNAYISLITPELLDLIKTVKPKIKYTTLYTKVHRLGLPNRTKQLLKYFATKLRDNLPAEAIDLLQGRINRSVFLLYYYKPFLKDIRNRTIKEIEPLQNELLEILS